MPAQAWSWLLHCEQDPHIFCFQGTRRLVGETGKLQAAWYGQPLENYEGLWGHRGSLSHPDLGWRGPPRERTLEDEAPKLSCKGNKKQELGSAAQEGEIHAWAFGKALEL